MERRKILLHQLGLVSMVFVLTQVAMALVLAYMNYSYFNLYNWIRADSGHYLSIAEKGYEFMSCSEVEGFGANSPYWCGNTGWFPGYPYLLRWLTTAFGNPILIGGIISKVFFAGTLWLVLIIAKVERISWHSLSFLSLAGFAFGNVYYSAVFPISTVLFFALASFYFILKGRTGLAAAGALITSFLYSTGFLLAIAMAVYIMLQKDLLLKRKVVRTAIILLGGFSGVALFFIILQLEVGAWDAFIRVQAKYGHGAHNPLGSIKNMILQLNLRGLTVEDFPTLQSVLVLTGYGLAAVVFVLKKQHQSNLKLLTFIYLTLYLIFPWTIGGNLSMYRAEALLLPFVFLLKDAPLKYILAVLLVLLAVSVQMSFLFFNTFLI